MFPSRVVALLMRTLGGLACFALLAAIAMYAVSEWKLRRHYVAPLQVLRAQSPPDLGEGLRLSRIVGCWAGCHGDRGEGGRELIEDLVRNTAPTLSAVLPLYDDEELVRLIRYGVKQDGRSALGMISHVFWPLADQDLANIIAHLRRQPDLPPIPRELYLTIRGRFALVTGELKVSAALVDRSRPRWGELPRSTPFERGRYYASITCAECHGVDFHGYPLEGGPSLAVLALYSEDQFQHLLRTGEPIGGRDLGLMSEVAREAFSLFTDAEIADLYDFLRQHHGL
jgi:cytochrome c553